MENVIKYFESLEQRLAALETAAKADAALEAAQETVIAGLQAKIEELEAKIAELEARPAATPVVETEPEVEVELVFDEEEPKAPETPEEPEKSEEPEVPVVPEIPEKPEEPVEPEPEPVVEEQPKAEPKAAFSAQVGAPVDDIRKAISIGDRFLFIRELFGGNGEALQKTIDELNKQASLADAEALVRKRFHWDEESAAAQLFMNILKRRFS